ncbi:MAG: TetR/AcrR family transcriptional regulator [Hyphomicrobiales bacterium]
MPRTADQALARSRRKEILDAAAACFIERGTHQTTMREIIARAGLSAGAVYSYFDGKDALIEALAARERAEIEDLAAHLESVGDPVRAIVEAVHAIISECSHDDARLAIELLAEASRNEAVKQAVGHNDQALREAFADAIARAMRTGAISSPLPAPLLLETVIALYEGFVGRIAVDDRADRDAFAAAAASALRRLFGAGP